MKRSSLVSMRRGVLNPTADAICGNLTPRWTTSRRCDGIAKVQTIFHEFGHLLHQLLSRVE